VTVDHHDVGALLGHSLGRRTPVALACAGDDGDSIDEPPAARRHQVQDLRLLLDHLFHLPGCALLIAQ
jgi:hypothetical protein